MDGWMEGWEGDGRGTDLHEGELMKKVYGELVHAFRRDITPRPHGTIAPLLPHGPNFAAKCSIQPISPRSADKFSFTKERC